MRIVKKIKKKEDAIIDLTQYLSEVGYCEEVEIIINPSVANIEKEAIKNYMMQQKQIPHSLEDTYKWNREELYDR